MNATEPLWMNVPRKDFYARHMGQGRHWDVAIIGAGITGISCAWHLARAGVSVAVFEAHEVGSGTTGRTTSHLTEVLDTRYHQLIKVVGEEGARELAFGTREAIEFIERVAQEQQLDCQFKRLPGYLFARNATQADELAREQAAATRAGVAVKWAEAGTLPFEAVSALEFPNQAQMNPRSWLLGLAQALPAETCQIFEDSKVSKIEDGHPCRIEFAHGSWATADHVIEATHSPLNFLFFQTRLARYQSYAVAGPGSLKLDGLYWDLDDPYHYLRGTEVDGEQWLIVGGEDHKTGQEKHTEAALDRIANFARTFGVDVRRAWSSQIVRAADGVPMIGRNAASKHVFVATGFDGNGMTYGAMAGRLLAEECLGKKSRLAHFVEATRFTPAASFKSFVTENVDFPAYFVKDAVAGTEAKSVEEVEKGDGKLVRVGGKRVAVYRDSANKVHAVSAVCTHMGCHVHFNGAEKTWDCPCHGSRFGVDGEVIDGPAVTALAPVDLNETPAKRREREEKREEPRPSAPH
jgi:glycine/D-amino acid oxidase-like deaminating enzyme/nitrite reductase/ring-hydroxylating ferredoxin subunit